MAKSPASWHLLFGLLAFQNGFITETQLLEAVRHWLQNKSEPLDEILLKLGSLPADVHHLLKPMVDQHLRDHDEDPEKSLASIDWFSTLRTAIQELDDPDLTLTVDVVATEMASAESRQQLTSLGISSLSSGSQLGNRFRVLRPHKAGGLGFVSVAADDELPREVALKQIKKRYADDDAMRRRLKVEAEITGGLEHPHIVPVYGLGQDATGRPFYAMRFIRGASLKEAIEDFYQGRGTTQWEPEDAETSYRSRQEQQRSRFRRLLEKLIDTCEAMHYAHSRGVLHRDLKPGNVMLGRYGEVMVVDWGLAITGQAEPDVPASLPESALVPRSADESTGPQRGKAEGTPHFMAPEQAEGATEQYGPRTDVYSLGAILYCILTGKTPFAGNTSVETTLNKVRTGDFPRPRSITRSVSSPLEAVCIKAMSREPRDRYASAGDLAKDLQRWLDDEPVSAWREPWHARMLRWIRHHPRTVAALAASIALALGFSLILAAVIDSSRREIRSAYRDTRTAVNDFYTQVAEEGLLDVPGAEEVRTKLLQRAAEVYAQLAQKRLPEAEDESKRTLYRRARLAHELVQPNYVAAAVGWLEDARRYQQRRVNEAPTDFECLFDLSNTNTELGSIYLDSSDFDMGKRYLRSALENRKQLAKFEKGKTDPRLPRKLANTYMNLAVLLVCNAEQSLAALKTTALDDITNGKFKAIWNDLQEAKDLLKLSRESRDSGTRRGALANRLDAAEQLMNELRLEVVSAKLANYSEDQDALRRACREGRRMSADTLRELNKLRWALVPEVWQHLSTYHDYLHDLYEETGDPNRAQQETQKALDTLRELIELSPKNPRYRLDLAKSLYHRAGPYFRRAKYKEARAYYLEAIRWLEPSSPKYGPDWPFTHAASMKALANTYHRDKQNYQSWPAIRLAIRELHGLIRAYPDYEPAKREFNAAMELKSAIENQSSWKQNEVD